MNTTLSESLTGTIKAPFPEFECPPVNPFVVLHAWLERALAYKVREPKALALATVDVEGRASTRIVVISEFSEQGIVFTTHASSQKGRDLAANPWASGVLYWRETSQQIILNGCVSRLPDAKADALWQARPPATHAMSVASRQSADLHDITQLREQARQLAAQDRPLARPASYCALELRPQSFEFWANGTERLHERLRYDYAVGNWSFRYLQP